jgi:uncharacterized membrane protein YoaK (UPF0700 family)
MVTMRITYSQIQSLLGGYVDTAGFLALQGLFTAHVTGNFVTLGASWLLGSSGMTAKILALPVFCLVIVGTRIASFRLERFGLPILPTMLGVKTVLLAMAAVLALLFGPFRQGDTLPALVVGMVLVSAMAIQNAAHRIHYASAPPTTLMTGTTTQIMIDLADLIRGIPPDTRPEVQARVRRLASSVAAFALGCAAAATLFRLVGMWCFVVPPILAAASFAPGLLGAMPTRGQVP